MMSEPEKQPIFHEVNLNGLMKPSRDSTADQGMIEKLYVMCAVEMLPKLRDAQCVKPHFERYRSWLEDEYKLYKLPEGVPLVPESAEIVAMSSERRQQAIEDCYESSKGTHMWPVVAAAWRVYHNMIDIVEGRTKLLKLLIADGLLPDFYDWTNELSDLRSLWRTLGQKAPKMRILEIGAGTGGTTARVLKDLTSEDGQRLYGSYTFTDVSTNFFDAAQKRFDNHGDIQYQALDITKDPLQQRFEKGGYDLIIASNVSISPMPLCLVLGTHL